MMPLLSHSTGDKEGNSVERAEINAALTATDKPQQGPLMFLDIGSICTAGPVDTIFAHPLVNFGDNGQPSAAADCPRSISSMKNIGDTEAGKNCQFSGSLTGHFHRIFECRDTRSSLFISREAEIAIFFQENRIKY